MYLPEVAEDVCKNVGREFPDPLDIVDQMILRQLSSLVEESIELDEAMMVCLSSHTEDDMIHLGDECCDTTLTAYMVAYYAAGRAMKAGRRYLGIARSSGTADQLAGELARVVLSVRKLAGAFGLDLNNAIKHKVEIIFSRGWRANECPSEDVS